MKIDPRPWVDEQILKLIDKLLYLSGLEKMAGLIKQSISLLTSFTLSQANCYPVRRQRRRVSMYIIANKEKSLS